MAAAPIGTAYIVVRALTAGLKKDIERGVKDAADSPEVSRAGSAVGRSLGKGIAKGTDNEINRSGGFRMVFRSLGKIAGAAMSSLKLVGFGSAGLLAAGAVPNILSFVGSLQALVGVAGLLPAVIGSLGGLFATLKIGFSGVGEALKNMSDPAKFAEALKKLAPAAQEAVKAIKSLQPAFKELKLDVQEKLFKGLEDTIKTLGNTYLPLLKTRLGEIAVAANAGFKSIGKSLTDIKTVGALDKLLANTAKATEPLFAGLGQVLSAFLKIGAVGSEFLKPFADSFSDAASTFNAFIDRVSASGELKEWIQAGIDAFKDLLSIIGSIGRILGGIFKAAQDAGGSTLATLSEHLKTIADIVNGPAFQQGLRVFFEGINAGADAVASALPAIGDALVALAPLFSELAKALGPVFASVLTTFAGVVERLAPALVPIVQILGPALLTIVETLGPVILGLADALVPVIALLAEGLATALTVILPYFAKLGPFLAPIIALLGQGLVAALEFLGPLIADVARWLGEFFTGVGNGTSALQPFIDWITGTFVPALQGIWEALQTAYAVIAPIIGQIAALFMEKWPQISAIIQQVFSTIGTIISAAMTVIQTVITVVTTIIARIWSIWGDTIMGFVSGAFDAIASIIRGVLNIVQGIIRTVLAVIKGDWSGAWNGIKQVLTGVWQVIRGVIMTAMNIARAVISGGLAFIRAAWSAAWSVIQSVLSAAWNAIIGVFNGAVGRARAAMTAIINGITSVARGAIGILTGIGRSIIDGLVSGIRAGFGAVQAAASAVVNAIPGPIRKLMGIASPSKVMKKIGEQITAGLVAGLDGTAEQVADSVKKLASIVTQAFNAKGITRRTRDSLQKMLTDRNKQLQNYAKAQIAIADKIKVANEKLADLIKDRDALASKVSEGVNARANIATVAASSRSGITGVLANLQKQVAANSTFMDQLNKLRAAGLSKDALEQLMESGVEQGSKAAKALLTGGATGIAQVNALQSQIAAQAASLGKTGSSLYDAGVAAAQGLVKGLESQSAAIEKSMDNIAASMVAAIKKALGIRSPSKVFQSLGQYSGAGLVNGLNDMNKAASLAGRKLAMSAVPTGMAGGVGSYSSSGGRSGGNSFGDIHVTISVDDLDKMTKVGDFLDMLAKQRQMSRMTARSGTVTA